MPLRLVKLVRDRVDQYLSAPEVVYQPLPQELIGRELRRKLLEEVGEYLEEPSREELADVLEVVRALVVHEHRELGSLEELVRYADGKAEERGGMIEGLGMYVQVHRG